MNLAVFENLEHRLRSLPMQQIVERAADRQEDLMIELNLKQLDSGIRADGSKLPDYSPKTVAIKKKKGQPYDRMTLKDSGDTYNSERVKRYPGKYELIFQDKKSEMLQAKYGHEILGLTDTNLQRVREGMKPLMLLDVRNILKLRA